MKKLPIKKEFVYDPIGSYRLSNPYTISFIYPQKGQAFIVKGGSNDIDNYLKEFAKTMPCIVHHTFYKKWINYLNGEVGTISHHWMYIQILGLKKQYVVYVEPL